jgi:hypothetical protein
MSKSHKIKSNSLIYEYKTSGFEVILVEDKRTKKPVSLIVRGNFDRDKEKEELAVYLKSVLGSRHEKPRGPLASILGRIMGIANNLKGKKTIEINLDGKGGPEKIVVYGSDRYHKSSKTARIFVGSGETNREFISALEEIARKKGSVIDLAKRLEEVRKRKGRKKAKS